VTAFFWDSLEAGGGRTALITDRESVSYARLSERVECLGAELRALLPADFPRPLVLLEAINELDSIVAYLACLRARFPCNPGRGGPGCRAEHDREQLRAQPCPAA
jgi:acyl-CoA synthetase (AMP-forming)/AMP-acid ligase II